MSFEPLKYTAIPLMLTIEFWVMFESLNPAQTPFWDGCVLAVATYPLLPAIKLPSTNALSGVAAVGLLVQKTMPLPLCDSETAMLLEIMFVTKTE